MTESVELRGTQTSVAQFMSRQKGERFWIHLHVSTPCGSGSPLKRFSSETVTDSDLQGETIMTAIPSYFRFSMKPDSVSFELSKYNSIWQRPQTVQTLTEGRLSNELPVPSSI